MSIFRRIFRPRKHTRFHAGNGAFVFVGPYTDRGCKVQILDISEGGLAFIYPGSQQELDEAGYLSLMEGDTPYLDRVDFVTTSDRPCQDGCNTSGDFRRRGVQFRWLGIMHQKRLKEYIGKTALSAAA